MKKPIDTWELCCIKPEGDDEDCSKNSADEDHSPNTGHGEEKDARLGRRRTSPLLLIVEAHMHWHPPASMHNEQLHN